MTAGGESGSILVVDDDAAVRGLVVRILRSWGHVVISEAGSVAEALRCAATMHPDIVMVDIGLPRAYDNLGKMGTLILENGKAYALHRGTKIELPSQDGAPMLEYLKQAAAADPSPSPLAGRIAELEAKLGTKAKPATP